MFALVAISRVRCVTLVRCCWFPVRPTQCQARLTANGCFVDKAAERAPSEELALLGTKC